MTMSKYQKVGYSSSYLPVLLVSDLSRGTEQHSTPAVDDRRSETSLYATATALSAGTVDVRLSVAVQSRL